MHEKSDFHWTTEAEEAFKQMKQLIAELPMLTAPMEKEELIVYLVAAKETVSAVPMTKREAKQMPIYFVSRVLRVSKLNYTSIEKLVPALVHARKCLKRSSCTDGFGAGLILTNPEGMEFKYALRFRFGATNNEAEYEALIAGLRIAKQIGVKNLQANVDSRLVSNQVNGTYVAKEANMIRYLKNVKALIGSFKAFLIKQIPISENKKADALSKIASTSFAHLKIGMPTLRTTKVDLVGNNEALEINLDLLEERRKEAAIREAKSKAKMENTITQKYKTQALSQET
nr:reverse transcriptase domain-containing protein [Tanacetum cinerariifolium]